MTRSNRFFLGGDIGSTKTHVLIAGQDGQVAGFGESGPGNHETVGYDGLTRALAEACRQAFEFAHGQIAPGQIEAAGFGVSGYDWPSERTSTLEAIARTGFFGPGISGLDATRPGTSDAAAVPFTAVNDAILGLLAGSSEGWGLAVVAGTGCNCRGWDPQRRREGRVTGAGIFMGEGAGGSDLVLKAMQAVAHAWTRRGPQTRLSQAFVQTFDARDVDDLLEGVTSGRIHPAASAAPRIFELAGQGDVAAVEVVRWAGQELGELANAVIRQLEFEQLAFDVVMVGGLFINGPRGAGPILIEAMRQTIHSLAPGARLVPLTAPPVVGAVLLAMEHAGYRPGSTMRDNLINTFNK